MYAMVGSRPDLAYDVGMVCIYMSKPGKRTLVSNKMDNEIHKRAMKLNLTFKKGKDFKVRGYSIQITEVTR